MMTTKFCARGWTLALGLLAACQLPPDLLDVGDDESSGDGDTDSNNDGDGDGDTAEGETGEPALEPECVLQGSNLDGEPQPEDFFMLPDDCTTVCAEGWGHDVPRLESEWTLAIENLFDEPFARGQLAMAPDGRVVSVLSGPGQDFRVTWMTPEYAQPEFQIASLIQGDVLDFDIDPDGEFYYFVWTDGTTQRLVAMHHNNNVLLEFELELGPHHGYASQLVALDDGVIVALDDGENRLLRFDQAGELVFDEPIPETVRLDISPSGQIIALANTTMLSWANTQGEFMGSEPLAGVQTLAGLVAIDDTRVVFAGDEDDGSPGGGARAILREHGAMGPSWSHSYDRADEWCVEYQGHATEEQFTGVAQLGDGSLVVIGLESLGYPYGDNIDYSSQPWVAHVSADGEVLAYDRGLWRGRAIDVVARDDVAYVMVTEEGSVDFFGFPYVRKYSF